MQFLAPGGSDDPPLETSFEVDFRVWSRDLAIPDERKAGGGFPPPCTRDLGGLHGALVGQNESSEAILEPEKMLSENLRGFKQRYSPPSFACARRIFLRRDTKDDG